MKIPVTLKHKPVIVSPDYDLIDGHYQGKTDAKGLSLGLAQWNERGKVDISAKLWRHTGGKWSRQSEELPIHRVLDLAILICRAEAHFREAYRYPKLYDPNAPQLDRLPLQGGALNVEICTDNPMLDEDIALFRDKLAEQDERISERLHLLSDLLQDMGYGHANRRKTL